MYRLLLCLLLVCTKSSAALTFSIELQGYKYTRELVNEYQASLSAAFGEPVAYVSGDRFADVIVSNRALNSRPYFKAGREFRPINAVIEVTLPSQPAHGESTTAMVQSPVFLKTHTPPLIVDDRQLALDLLRNGRVTKIIDEFPSKGAFLMEEASLTITTIAEQQTVSVWFRESDMAYRFEQQATASSHTSVSIEEADTDVYLIYKHFNPETKSFERVEKEEELVRWLFEEQLGRRINIKGSNTQSAFETLVQADSSCILNVMKTPEREAVARFTTPTVDYLGPSVFVRADSELARAFALMQGSRISFEQLTRRYPDITLGYTVRVSKSLPEQMLASPQMVKVTQGDKGSALAYDYVRSIFMLERGRMDAVVEYPSVFYSAARQYDMEARFAGLHLNRPGKTMAAYIACSDTPDGERLVSQINQLLADDTKRARILALQLAGYSSKLQFEGMGLLNRHYQDAQRQR